MYPMPTQEMLMQSSGQRFQLWIAPDRALDIELIEVAELRRQQEGKGTAPSKIAFEPQEGLSLEDYFQQFVLQHQDQMSETELARKLGISRKCLWERRQRFSIPRSRPPTKKTG